MTLLARLLAPLRPDRSAGGWVWVLPNLVLGLFVLAMFALLVVLHRHEQAVQRNALAQDIQWAEQTIRTHFTGNQEFLQHLARGLADGSLDKAAFLDQAGRHLVNNPELVHIVWVDADQVVRWAAPHETTAWNAGERLSLPEQTLSFQRASRTELPAYSMPQAGADEEARIEVYVPVRRERTLLGAVLGIYAAPGILRHLAPAWFSGKYRLVLETEERVIGANSAVVHEADISDIVNLDPPGQGLRLRVSAYAAQSSLAQEMILALIGGLVLLMAWSLWALGAHVRRRLKAERERDRLFNLSLDPLCVVRLDGRIVRANPAFERVLGRSPERLHGSLLIDLVHPDDVPRTHEEIRKLESGEPSTAFENRCRCADGGYRWLVWSVNPALEEALFYCVAHDITDRKRSEDAVKTESAFRKAMEESVTTGLRAIDMEGRIIYVNPAFCRMVGLSAAQLVGCRPPFPYWPPDDQETQMRNLELTLAGQAPAEGFLLRIMHANGRHIDVRIYVSPLIDGDGKQTGWMAAMVDVTENRRIQEESLRQQIRLEETSRLIAMGEMASSLAHELNQPLAAISNYAMGCVTRLESDDFERTELLAAMRKASSQAERAGTIVRRMRDFVRKSEPHCVTVALAEIVDEAIGFAELEARKAGVDIRIDLPGHLPPVHADRIMVEQVLLNLVKNGIEAMAQTPRARRQLTVAARGNADGQIEVEVGDNGHGIASDANEKLFAPFFTTKPQGMGMGLNICRSIIEFHQGRLWAEPRAGGGTTFRFTLPVGR